MTETDPIQSLLHDLAVTMQPVSCLTPYARNARTHSQRKIQQIARSIETFGFVNPILVDAGSGIVAGHGRVEAAKLLGLSPAVDFRVFDSNQNRHA